MATQLQLGDVVTLRSGGPLMTVVATAGTEVKVALHNSQDNTISVYGWFSYMAFHKKHKGTADAESSQS